MFFLHSLQSPINVGMILRTAEVFGHGTVIYDPHSCVVDENLSIIADFACGALGRRPPIVSSSLDTCLNRIRGRLVATTLDGDATPLTNFSWQSSDCIVFGNEYDGLDSAFLKRTTKKVWVPVPPKHLPKPRSQSPIDPHRVEEVKSNGSVSLNVAATAAIVGAHIYHSLHMQTVV